MQNIDILHEKIDTLIKMHQEVKKENEGLRNQLIAAQGQNETLNGKIQELETTIAQKDTQVDAVVQKLESFTS